jgi:hypothetical protein
LICKILCDEQAGKTLSELIGTQGIPLKTKEGLFGALGIIHALRPAIIVIIVLFGINAKTL